MKKANIMPAAVLASICLVVALLLSFINLLTAPIIKEAQDKAVLESLTEVLPDGKDFTELDIDASYPSVITKGYKADGGYVFQASVTGKSSGLIVLCGISADGKIVGTKVISDKETDGYDKKIFPLVQGTDGKYAGASLDGFEPLLISGATLTSRAYGEAVKASLTAFTVANGGEITK